MEIIENVGGRPARVFTEEEINEVSTLAAVLTKAQLADYFGISENTFRAVEERQPEVFEAYKKGKAKATAMMAGHLVRQAQNGNTAATIFWLKTQAGWKENDVTALIEQADNVITIVRATGTE